MKKRKLFKIVLSSSLIFIVLFVVFWIIQSNNNSSIGTTITVNHINNNSLKFNYSLSSNFDSFVTIGYPKFLKIVPNYKFYLPVVDEFNYSYPDIESWDLSISIYHFGSSSLQDNNAYQFRLENPNIYSPSTEVVNGQNIVIFSNQSMGGFNKIAFLINGTYQATISLIGDDQSGQAPLQKTFDLILSNWHWKV